MSQRTCDLNTWLAVYQLGSFIYTPLLYTWVCWRGRGQCHHQPCVIDWSKEMHCNVHSLFLCGSQVEGHMNTSGWKIAQRELMGLERGKKVGQHVHTRRWYECWCVSVCLILVIVGSQKCKLEVKWNGSGNRFLFCLQNHWQQSTRRELLHVGGACVCGENFCVSVSVCFVKCSLMKQRECFFCCFISRENSVLLVI